MKQVIRIDRFGRAKSLRMPAGVGFDLRSLGDVTMRRVSDIELDEHYQQYKVKIKGVGYLPDGDGTPKLFPGYEDGVAAEVEYFNKKFGCSTAQ